MEYKGEYLATNEDSDYKKALGVEWEKLSESGYYFKWAEKKDVERIIEKTSEL